MFPIKLLETREATAKWMMYKPFFKDPSLSITPAAKRQCQRSLQVTLQCLSHEGIWGVGLMPEHDVDILLYLQVSASGLTCGDSRNWIIWLCISPNPTSRSVSEKSVQLCSIAQVERRPFSARSRSKSTPREATVGKLQAGLTWDHPVTIDVSCFPSWNDDWFFIIVHCTFSLGMAWMCRVPTYSPKLRPTGPTYSPKTPPSLVQQATLRACRLPTHSPKTHKEVDQGLIVKMSPGMGRVLTSRPWPPCWRIPIRFPLFDDPEAAMHQFLMEMTTKEPIVWSQSTRTMGKQAFRLDNPEDVRLNFLTARGPRREGGSRWNGWVARWTLERFGQRRTEMKAVLRWMGLLAGTLKRRSGRGPSWRYLSGFDWCYRSSWKQWGGNRSGSHKGCPKWVVRFSGWMWRRRCGDI